MNLMRWRPLFAGLLACIGLGVAASCSSDDQTPGGGRIERPIAGGPTKAPPPSTSLAPSPASAAVSSAPSVDRPLSLSERFEQRTGLKLSPLDKIIAEDCPERPWSKDVPERRCKKDSECGDGFCDRERCAPLWTCFQQYSRPCERDDHCPSRLCIDGRCRSCVSDAECKWDKDNQDPKCTPDSSIPGARECRGVAGGRGDGVPSPGPVPQRPKQ
jgi:hypothetical protein